VFSLHNFTWTWWYKKPNNHSKTHPIFGLLFVAPPQMRIRLNQQLLECFSTTTNGKRLGISVYSSKRMAGIKTGWSVGNRGGCTTQAIKGLCKCICIYDKPFYVSKYGEVISEPPRPFAASKLEIDFFRLLFNGIMLYTGIVYWLSFPFHVLFIFYAYPFHISVWWLGYSLLIAFYVHLVL